MGLPCPTHSPIWSTLPAMLSQLLTITRNTFVESIRQPIFIILILAAGLGQIINVLLSAYSMGYTEDALEVSGDDKLLLDMGLATVLGIATLLAAFIATSVLSREIENKTALTVISKPVGRPLFITGKFLGASGAVLMAATIMLVFFLFAIRHEVMSTARDTIDGPVIVFTSLALLVSLGMASWTNYFYGWVFPSTASVILLPAILVAYLVTLSLNKEWVFVGPQEAFKPQILMAAICIGMALLVLNAVAIAASTRLGQVMTIVVCAGVFMGGLLSNHLLGRFAFQNSHIATIRSVQEPFPPNNLNRAGDTYEISLEDPSQSIIPVGTQIYFGPNPAGVALAVPPQGEFLGDPTRDVEVRNPDAPSALVIRSVDASTQTYTLVNVNNHPVARPPRAGDFIFLQPTRHNAIAFVAWSVVPNLQVFWLSDAITQGHPIPPRYLLLTGAYTGVQVLGLLSLAILLFQRRDVG